MRKRHIAGIAVAAVPAVIVCALLLRAWVWPVPIREILMATEHFLGRTVTVRGMVDACFLVPPRGRGIFRIEDRTGKILVVTDTKVPPRGRRASARGRVQRSKVYGTVIVTGSRRTRIGREKLE